MWTPTTSWLATLAAGLLVALVLRLVAGPRSRSPWWAAALVGLVGAAIGRVLLNVALFTWHPSFSGGVGGALVLSAAWLAIAGRRRTAV